jgi:hypothetical protein
MSGGKRRGEVRIRKARPVEKQAGGTHNRKARRAAKAKPPETVTPPVFDEAQWRANYERRRAERNAYWASKTDAELQDITLGRSEAVQWDPLLLTLLDDAVPLWVVRHFRTEPDARIARAHELGDLLAYSQAAAAIADPDARGTEKPGELAAAFNAVAEGIAIGAYCPEGATFIGTNWQVVAASLRITWRSQCTSIALGGDLGPYDASSAIARALGLEALL